MGATVEQNNDTVGHMEDALQKATTAKHAPPELTGIKSLPPS
jgi:hypothetical protein